jgi:cytochrome c5
MKHISSYIAIIITSAACVSSVIFAKDLRRVPRSEAGTRTAQMPGGMMNGGGRGMMQHMMPDMLPPGISPEDLPEPDSPGARLVARYCGQCHNIPSPAMHSAQEWPAVADRMFYRMSMMSGSMEMMMNVEPPTAEERKTIVAYLRKYAQRSIPPEAIPFPDTQGAAQFKKSCSNCHALPDPGAHTAGEWPQIVERMQAHMRAMNKGEMSENEKKDIVNYLVRNARRSSP